VLDRVGTSLLSAGDLDLAATACDIGLGNGLFTSLKLTHLVPRERLEENYLLRLTEAQALSGWYSSHLDRMATYCTARMEVTVADQLRTYSWTRKSGASFGLQDAASARGLESLSNCL